MKDYYCKTCYSVVVFDEKIRSKNGKAIPLNQDRTRHECLPRYRVINNKN
jgi:hypothetical protein